MLLLLRRWSSGGGLESISQVPDEVIPPIYRNPILTFPYYWYPPFGAGIWAKFSYRHLTSDLAG